MNILYLDCSMGAAGDMLLASLLELHPNPEDFLRRFNALGLPGVTVTVEKAVRRGISGTHAAVKVFGREEDDHLPDHDHDHGHGHDHHHHDHDHDHHHHHEEHHSHDHHDHHTVGDILHLIETLPVPETVRSKAAEVYGLLAAAESRAHGTTVDQIHFHEVGTLDAVADVVGVCLLMEELHPDLVAASTVHVGFGQVRCAHGILPVPAPATAYLLEGVPVAAGAVEGELCTPTGAALLRAFVQRWGPMPSMTVERWGYGLGTRDFPGAANCLRSAWGSDGGGDQVVCLQCQMDDITGEDLAFAAERLMELGALDVFTAPITMKKGRPGHLLTCLVRPEKEEALTEAILRYTTTLGVRRSLQQRTVLERRQSVRSTVLGPVVWKESQLGDLRREKAEYEDLSRLARERGLSMEEVRRLVRGIQAEK